MLFRYLFQDSMVVYAAFEPPGASADKLEGAEDIVFVKDGFSFLAALVPPLWLLAHNLWLEVVAYLIAAVGVLVVLEVAGVGANLELAVIAGLHLWFGFEAAGIRRWNLVRRGWRALGPVTGTSMLDCERRFFDAWLAQQGKGNAGGVPSADNGNA